MPKRIQRKRTKGYKMPESAVYVGRPTKWGNPFRVGISYCDNGTEVVPQTVEEVVELYHAWVLEEFDQTRIWRELGGRDLVCWCPLARSCHADVLLELANGGPLALEAGGVEERG